MGTTNLRRQARRAAAGGCACRNPKMGVFHFAPPQGDLMDPSTSLRDCTKQLCLLEIHLAVPQSRCPDCITKHLLTAEAFAEESAQLGPDSPPAATGRQIADALRKLQPVWHTNPIQAAKLVRRLRKAAQPYT